MKNSYTSKIGQLYKINQRKSKDLHIDEAKSISELITIEVCSGKQLPYEVQVSESCKDTEYWELLKNELLNKYGVICADYVYKKDVYRESYIKVIDFT